MLDEPIKWTVRTDVFRPTTDFSDLLSIVASNYELYSKAHAFMGPWIAKQANNSLMIPDKDEIKAGVGKPRGNINSITYQRFIDGLFDFALKSKGRKALIIPNPTTHHSAQFTSNTFSFSSVDKQLTLRDDHGTRKPAKLTAINFYGAAEPVYIENLTLRTDEVKFIIVRPKLGKLGTPSVKRWEVLLYKKPITHLVNHVDSELNPRWAGIY